MKRNVTLSAEESLIEQAREKAARERQTLNSLFRQWLQGYLGNSGSGDSYRDLMSRLSYADSGRTFSREDLNAR